VDISTKHGITKHILLRTSCSPKEVMVDKDLFQEFSNIFTWFYSKMSGIIPAIVENHINTWPNTSLLWKKQLPIHPTKVLSIKAKIDHLHQTCFIYPIAYTAWVSNLVMFNKKKGTIYVCIGFHDLNRSCPKFITLHHLLTKLFIFV